MRRAGATLLLAGLAAGCAGNVRPAGAGDLPIRARTGITTTSLDTTTAPGVPGPSSILAPDLQPLPLPSGLTADDFDIPLEYNGRVQHWLDYYARQRATFSGWLGRMAGFQPLIRSELSDAGLPGDLQYLALIESGFTRGATSSAGAAGIWQLMPATARAEGLEVSTYVDERRDPVRATEAAVRHLKALYDQLGSWYLVAAAYNSGSGRVARALDALADGARGADSLFWQIEPALPAETRDYVPRFLAASILAKFPERFGVAPDQPARPEAWDSVHIEGATDLAAVARAARADPDEIRRLNPEYVLEVTPPGRTVLVRVPPGEGGRVRARLAAMPRRERVHDLHHTVAQGETPESVARLYDIGLAALRRANRLSRRTVALAAGRVLRIPLGPPPVLASRAAAGRKAARRGDPPAGAATYVVRAGDTLWDIGHAHGVSVDSLRAWNDLPPGSILHPGQWLEVEPPRP